MPQTGTSGLAQPIGSTVRHCRGQHRTGAMEMTAVASGWLNSHGYSPGTLGIHVWPRRAARTSGSGTAVLAVWASPLWSCIPNARLSY